MTLSQATSIVTARGFVARPQIPHYAEESPWCAYLQRGREYLLLVGAPFHEGFLEAVHETYIAPKETRRPKGKDSHVKGEPYTAHQKAGFLPITATLLRGTQLNDL